MSPAPWLTALALCSVGSGRALAPTRSARAAALPRFAAARWPDAAPRDDHGAEGVDLVPYEIEMEIAPLSTGRSGATDSMLDPAMAEAACGGSPAAMIFTTFAITAAGPSAALASLTPDEELAAKVFAQAGSEAALGRKEAAAALVLPLLAYKVSAMLNRTPLMVSLDATIALATLAAIKVWFLEG